ncbi:hypothetical protein QLQ12_27695 [Actinoplanes sp. NEAU-A12]|uniref:Uncharacterized protein n=1 Tax=Actinoplanes sandaracinus TaxID=3045177 RepID=A0ABT6WRN6_9ACTN|nr:hypothetical protein [Actinoplanes sandaracinus]MDI6102408.1 hypothetical protein [Actinoplanes sandaracinus]
MVVPDPRQEQQPLLSTPGYTPPNTMSATTRHLASAPYIDVTFANTVIKEVVESERKAVPPSYGFDIDPVVRHSLRARRLLLLRYGLVTALLLLGLLWLSPIATVAWLAVCVVGVGARSRVVRRLPPRTQLAVVAAVVVFGFCFVAYPLLQLVSRGLPDLFDTGNRGDWGSVNDVYGDTDTGLGFGDLFLPLLLAAAMFAILFLSRRHVFGVITTELAPDAPASAPRSTNGRVERRLAMVAAMQRGNISVHDSDPFLGAGWIDRGWSFAIALNPNPDDDGNRPAERIRLDGGELNRRVMKAIVDLRSADLSDGEKVSNVYVIPYVVADGYRRIDDPLIDPRTRAPYTLASAETLAAIEQCPQGGLRHYLRAVVPATGKEIRTPAGRPVLPAQDSGVAVTAFVHLALEGGMLYTEFVATVMPDVQWRYQIGDVLRPERVPLHAAEDTLRSFVRDNLFGPLYLVQTAWDAIRLQSRMARSARRAEEFRYYDYGADLSVRDLGAEVPIGKFMQHLDAAKYISLLDKTVSEAILEFLEEHDVDTAEFRAKAANMSFDYSTKTFHGGQQVFGNNNKISQANAPRPPKSGGTRG